MSTWSRRSEPHAPWSPRPVSPDQAPPVEPVGSLPSDLAKEAAGRLRGAAEMGDVSELEAIAEEFLGRPLRNLPPSR